MASKDLTFREDKFIMNEYEDILRSVFDYWYDTANINSIIADFAEDGFQVYVEYGDGSQEEARFASSRFGERVGISPPYHRGFVFDMDYDYEFRVWVSDSWPHWLEDYLDLKGFFTRKHYKKVRKEGIDEDEAVELKDEFDKYIHVKSVDRWLSKYLKYLLESGVTLVFKETNQLVSDVEYSNKPIPRGAISYIDAVERVVIDFAKELDVYPLATKTVFYSP